MFNKLLIIATLFLWVFSPDMEVCAREIHEYLFRPDEGTIQFFALSEKYGIVADNDSNLNYESPYARCSLNWDHLQPVNKTKSKGKAFFLSLLLPGLGEKYGDAQGKFRVFFCTEIVLWTGFAGFKTFSIWRKQDYRTFAASHAAVNLSDKSDSYFTKLERYNTIQEYNDAMLRDRNLQDYYRDIERYYWRWDSDENRHKFRQLRISSDQANNRALLMVAAIVTNHIVSAIDAMWLVHKYNKGVGLSSLEFNIKADQMGSHCNITLKLSKHF